VRAEHGGDDVEDPDRTDPVTDSPALAFHDLVVKASTFGDAPETPHATRELPDLARFLFHALGAEVDEDVSALDRLTLAVARGESVALVGEAGGGKSTIARTCARRLKPTSGKVELDGVDVHRARGKSALVVRRHLQVLFDDDEAALDPRLPVRESFRLAARALRLDDVDARIARALDRARVRSDVLDVRAADLHAGDRKRAGLARALLSEPAVLVVDEPAGGLDPSERAVVLETLVTLRGSMSFVFLCADLAAARTLADRVGVLHKGALVEIDAADVVFSAPKHPYAQALVAAAPRARR
jgi:peptide/nickel transport system ATP-binding protein